MVADLPGSNLEGVRVRVHPGLCEGWGLCHRFGGSIYPLDAEGFVDLHVLEVPPELAAAARLGASVCPAHAISILAARRDPATVPDRRA